MKKKLKDEPGQSLQARRVVWMLKKLQNGGRFTAKEFKKELEQEFGELSLRTVQRDLSLLLDCENMIETYQEGKAPFYFYSRVNRRPTLMRIDTNEVLSFHILKAHLKNFKGTIIEEQVRKLSKKLDDIAPEDVFLEDSLYWDKNIGQYDYTQFDPLIRRIIHYITNKKWVDIQYQSLESNESRLYTVFFRSIFTYAGYLYVVAYVPNHDNHLAFAIHRMEAVNERENYNQKVPSFDKDEFSRIRFGVYWGEAEDVELFISKEHAHYFENRVWHPTQTFGKDRLGNLTIKMKVPIVTDFVSWILSWSDLITVRKPKSLIERLINQSEKLLKLYK